MAPWIASFTIATVISVVATFLKIRVFINQAFSQLNQSQNWF